MKKTTKVISYMLLLVPLALPAACSPIGTNDGRNSGHGHTDYDSEHLRAIVDDYLDEKTNTDSIRFVPVESEQEKKEELAALEKTGEWSTESPKSKTAPTAAEYRSFFNTPVRKKIEPIRKITPVRKTPTGKVGGFPITINRQVNFYLDQFRNRQQSTFRRWLERSSKYLPFITRELKKAGLPEELVYLAMIESGFNPSAYSSAHASGLWQFIPGTGRDYGLRIDSWVDERRDPEKSTKAAITYLKALYKRFNDWQLAVAAYNAGEGRIEQGLRKYNADNFWELARHPHLHLETKRYVPELIAAILVAENPERYGFTNIRRSKPVSYDLVRIPARTSLRAVAASASLSVSTLRELNNDLLKDRVPPARNGYALKVPVGTSNLIAANLPQIYPLVSTKYTTHKVRRNETLNQISRRYKISMASLLKANNTLRTSTLRSGQRLRIPSQAKKYGILEQRRISGDYYAASNSNMISHKLTRGETLFEISRKYNVPLKKLMRWNNITDTRTVRVGSRLSIYRPQTPATNRAASVQTSVSSRQILAATSKKRPDNPKTSIVRTAADSTADLNMIITDSNAVNPVQLLTTGKKRPDAEVTSVVQNASARISGTKAAIDQPPQLIAAGKKRPDVEETSVVQNASVAVSNTKAVVTLSEQKKQKPEKRTNIIVAEHTAVSYYRVRNGDSLWSIARKLQVSTGEIRRWNSLRDNRLHPGTTLVIKNT